MASYSELVSRVLGNVRPAPKAKVSTSMTADQLNAKWAYKAAIGDYKSGYMTFQQRANEAAEAWAKKMQSFVSAIGGNADTTVLNALKDEYAANVKKVDVDAANARRLYKIKVAYDEKKLPKNIINAFTSH